VFAVLGDALQKELGTSVIVVNKLGGSGAVGHSAIAKAKPDGYTIGMATVELSMLKKMGIGDLTYRNYRPLMQINADCAAVVVRSDAPWETFDEFLAAVKTSDEKLKMSGTASGGIWDLARVGMMQAAKVDPARVTWVPSKGAAPAIVQLLGGHIDAVCVSVPEALPQIEAGELRVLAVMNEERLPEFPDLPTLKEHDCDWSAVGWRGLVLPTETPPEVVTKLETACTSIANSSEFKSFMEKSGFAIVVRGPDEFETFLDEQEQAWGPVVEAAGYAR